MTRARDDEPSSRRIQVRDRCHGRAARMRREELIMSCCRSSQSPAPGQIERPRELPPPTQGCNAITTPITCDAMQIAQLSVPTSFSVFGPVSLQSRDLYRNVSKIDFPPQTSAASALGHQNPKRCAFSRLGEPTLQITSNHSCIPLHTKCCFPSVPSDAHAVSLRPLGPTQSRPVALAVPCHAREP